MTENLIPVCRFNALGINRVRNFLMKVRSDRESYAQEAAEFLNDGEYVEKISEDIQIDSAREFADKYALVEYMTELFPDSFLDDHRKDIGLWTWIAMVYYVQLTKTCKNHEQTAESRWIFDPDQPRVARRHFIAGAVYLYRDLQGAGNEVLDMVFCGPVGQFNTITDQLTHVHMSVQTPAFLRVVGWLYYDPTLSQKMKRGTTGRKAGSLFELQRLAMQLVMTWDFYESDKAGDLWNKLPAEFNRFKGDSSH